MYTLVSANRQKISVCSEISAYIPFKLTGVSSRRIWANNPQFSIGSRTSGSTRSTDISTLIHTRFTLSLSYLIVPANIVHNSPSSGVFGDGSNGRPKTSALINRDPRCPRSSGFSNSERVMLFL